MATMTEPEADRLDQAWAAVVAGDPAPPARPPLVVTGSAGGLASAFDVAECAVAAIGVALGAAAALQRERGGASPPVRLDRAHAAAAVTSERHFTGTGASGGAGFAPLSRFWRTADGWVRTHANYPWHRRALLDALGGIPDDVDAVARTIAAMSTCDVEDRTFAAGGIAAGVRAMERWGEHPQGRAVAGEPLVGHDVVGAAPARRRPAGPLPASGVRVLDLTRVIAGPVCTRYLAALGADVVRVDPPHRPDLAPGATADTLLGKRSTVVDLAERTGADAVRSLVASADVVVCGYRPGSLDRFGLHPEALAAQNPGLVVVVLSAWGHHGPWAGRRGFDSVVQAPTGIAAGESPDAATPGALPCQFLDHGTGYLAAAAALDGLRRQHAHGGTHVRRVSLARTAAWLTAGGPAPTPPMAGPALEPAPFLVRLAAGDGEVTAVAPPGALGMTPLRWPSPAPQYGQDPPSWQT